MGGNPLAGFLAFISVTPQWTLLDLYHACAADALLTGARLTEEAQGEHD
jgi:hypothetical protein